MKASVTLAVITLLILGTFTVVAARFVQMPATRTVPFTERHDVNLGYVSPFTYTISPGNAPYLNYSLRKGTVVRATYTISGGSGDDINFYIKDSAGNTVFNPGRVANTYSYYFAAPKDDSYRVYMDNSFSIFSTKTVNYRVIEAYYMDLSYEPRTIYLTIGQLHPWVEWIGIGGILFPVGIIMFLGVKSLGNSRRIAAQARAEEEARLKAEQQLAAEREQQHLKEEEERRRLAVKQNAENLMKAGRYEEAAKLFDQLQMWDEAGECRRLDRTSYVVAADVHVGKDGISVNCPHCGSSERLESKVSEVTCRHCARKYFLPKKILDMI